MSYRELWETWSAPGGPDRLVAHLAALAGRYAVPHASDPEP